MKIISLLMLVVIVLPFFASFTEATTPSLTTPNFGAEINIENILFDIKYTDLSCKVRATADYFKKLIRGAKEIINNTYDVFTPVPVTN